MTIASAFSRAIDQAAGKRRAVTGSHVGFQAIFVAYGACESLSLECWSVFGMNPDLLAPSRPPPTP